MPRPPRRGPWCATSPSNTSVPARLLPGAWLTVTDAHGGQAREYRFGLAGRWAMSVDGDTAVLTLHGRLARLTGCGVTRRSHRPESVCGDDDSRDAACYRSTDPVATATRSPWPGCPNQGVRMDLIDRRVASLL